MKNHWIKSKSMYVPTYCYQFWRLSLECPLKKECFLNAKAAMLKLSAGALPWIHFVHMREQASVLLKNVYCRILRLFVCKFWRLLGRKSPLKLLNLNNRFHSSLRCIYQLFNILNLIHAHIGALPQCIFDLATTKQVGWGFTSWTPNFNSRMLAAE